MIDQESLLAELGLLDKRKLLLELTIQLGVNESDVIYLYEGDDIDMKAFQFCEKHQLKDEVKDIIVQNIKANLNEKENYFSFVNQSTSNVNTNKTPLDKIVEKPTKKVKEQRDKPNDLLNKSTPSIKKTDIYTKQVKQQMCKNNVLQKQRQEKEQELMKNVTFKPKLSQNTLKIVTTARQNRNKTPEYYLLKYGQQMQEHRKQAEQQLQNETSRECSFKPEINKTSQKIYDESIKKDVSMTKFDQLYEQAKKKNKTEKSCVTQESRLNTTTKRSISRSKTPNKQYLPFLERMEMQKKIKEDKLKQEIEESFLYDEKSGQKLYQPSVNTAHRSRGGLSIGEYLYQQQKSVDESIVQFECDDLSKSMQTERSNQIVLQMRKKKLEEFFKLMDSDNDGLISAAHIYLEDLPTEALELLQPIILQLEKLDIYLNIETWTAKCMDIVEKMNVADKNRLFQKSFKQKTDPVDQSTFKPQLNHKSEMLVAKQRQVFKGPAALYEKAMKENFIKENKIKHIKEQKEQQESRQCTFQPKIKSFNRSTTHSIIYQ